MAQVTATIASKVGLHARPAATFVKAVAEKGVPAGLGDVVTLASDADGAEAALEDLKALLETDLDA